MGDINKIIKSIEKNPDETLKNNLRKEKYNIKKTTRLLVGMGLSNLILMATGIIVNNPRDYLIYAAQYLYYLKKNYKLKNMKKD